jgi:hypothetical protein
MPVNVFQLVREDAHVELEQPYVDQDWACMGSDDPAVIYPAIAAALPSTYRGLYLSTYSPSLKGGGWTDIRVHYDRTIPLLKDIFHFSGETTGKTLKRELSLETVRSYTPAPLGGVGPPALAPDFKGLIGVSEDTIAGVEIPAPGFTFTATKRFYANPVNSGVYAATAPSNTFLSKIIHLSPRANSAAFSMIWKTQILTFDVKELVFHGAQITDPGRDPDGQELVELAYKFEYSHTFSVANGNAITNIFPGVNIEKSGWDYLWVYYKRQMQTPTGGPPIACKTPLYVYIERVFELDDFMALGL